MEQIPDIFYVKPEEEDPWLLKLVDNTAIGSLGTSLHMYTRHLENGLNPEEAYEKSLSIPEDQ